MASQKLKWKSHKNSGKSWRSTSSTRSDPPCKGDESVPSIRRYVGMVPRTGIIPIEVSGKVAIS